MMKRNLQSAAIIGAVLLICACGDRRESQPASLFPATSGAEGWNKSGETRTFEANRLWEYIDGDAERYTQAGVVRTLTADYRFKDQIEAVADIHIMRDAEGARKVFDSESAVESRPVQLGEDARLYSTSLVFRKSQYLVRITAYQDAPGVGDALVELARAIERRL